MNRFVAIMALAGSITLAACHSSFTRVDTSAPESLGVRLDPSWPVVVAVPQDGSFEGTTYSASGLMVAQETVAAFRKHATKVDLIAPVVQDEAALLEAAHQAKAGYLAISTIVSWEPRATRWSGLPSTTSIKMAIFDVTTGRTIKSAVLDGQSHSGIGIGIGPGTTPERLLPHLIGDYVNGLY